MTNKEHSSKNNDPRLVLYVADLVCMVPDSERGDIWFLAPKTNGTHQTQLIVVSGRIKNGGWPGALGFPEKRPSKSGKNRIARKTRGLDSFPYWILSQCEVTVEGSPTPLDPNWGDLSANGIPRHGEDHCINWLANFAELSRCCHDATIKERAFGHGAGSLLSARLRIKTGGCKVARFTRFVTRSWLKKKRLEKLYFCSNRNVSSSINRANSRAVANVVAVTMALDEQNQITFCRESFSETGRETLVLCPDDQGLLEVVFVNFTKEEAAHRNQFSRHFGYFYPLLDGWHEPEYYPYLESRTSRISFLEDGDLPRPLDRIRRSWQGGGREKMFNILDPAFRCIPPMGFRKPNNTDSKG